MPRKKQNQKKGMGAEELLQANRWNISFAQERLKDTPLALLAPSIKVEEVRGLAVPPSVGMADPATGTIFVNPHHSRKGRPLETHEWQCALGHLLLHLGLNHAARREDRDPMLWNAACEVVNTRLLAALRFPIPLTENRDLMHIFRDMSEESIYDEILMRQQAGDDLGSLLLTLAGPARPDIAGLSKPSPWHQEWEDQLAEGIRQAAENTVAQTAYDLLDEQDKQSAAWPPLERVRRWVMTDLPLLGALAAQIKVVADARLCDRMDIRIAAVNGFLGEMYFHTECALSSEELKFVYVHELLHVALLHHSRVGGRDPYVWNLAADFVINGWLIEMGVGTLPKIGGLYDPRLQGMGAEEVYDLLVRDPKRCKGLRGFRGGLGDVLLDVNGRRISRDDVTTLDDVYRRCLAAGMACQGKGRGVVPAALIEEIRSLFTPPIPWDVELAQWMDRHVPIARDFRRSYARASRRQASTPDIPRPARYIPQEIIDSCTFGVVLDTSGSMDRELLGRALGAIASYSDARDVPAVRLVLCDAAPYDRGYVSPTDLRGVFAVQGRGGTVLQPAINHLINRADFPPKAPVMIITDGWCETEIICPREHCFVFPRKSTQQNSVPLRTSAPIFRVLKEEQGF
jgi:predicted metal-dependent peptidase